MGLFEELAGNTAFVSDVQAGMTAPQLIERHKIERSERRVREVRMRLRELLSPLSRTQPVIQAVRATESDLEPSRRFIIPESTQPLCNQWLRLEGDYGLISDMHVPFHDAEVIGRFCDMCYARNIRKFALIGDTLDSGQYHPKRGKNQHHGRTWQDDVEVARRIFTAMLPAFPEGGVILMGNHDNWFTSHMRGQVEPQWFFGKVFHELPSLVYSEYEQAELTSGGKPFRLLHGANYSGSNPLGVAQGYAAKFESGIVMGHQHHACSGWSRSGKHQVVCLGGAYDPARFGYINISPRTNPAQTRSYAIVKDGLIKTYDIGA